jgi:hypothetical protein
VTGPRSREARVELGDPERRERASASQGEKLHLAYAFPNTSFNCCVTRTNVVRFESSRNLRAPT